MTGRRDPAKPQIIETEVDESSSYFGGVAVPPRFPRQDVAQFTCRRLPGDGEFGYAYQFTLECRDGEGERSPRFATRLERDPLEIRRGVGRRVGSPPEVAGDLFV